MQVYVHLAGKNHGPYSIDQLRQYVQAGNFRDDHLACYDGTNWVKIKDVPGFGGRGEEGETCSAESTTKSTAENQEDADKEAPRCKPWGNRCSIGCWRIRRRYFVLLDWR